MAKDVAIVLNNGGVKSAVVASLAAQKHRLVFVQAELVQPPPTRARAAYDQQVAHFKPYREHTLSMPFLSTLNIDAHKPVAANDPRLAQSVASQLLELAPLVALGGRFAAHYQATSVYLGVCVGDQTDGLAQATECFQIWNEMFQLPCQLPDLEVVTPLLELEPWQVVDLGFQVGAPFERTWSCLEDLDEPCWACRGCRRREAAFQQAAKPDPLKTLKRN